MNPDLDSSVINSSTIKKDQCHLYVCHKALKINRQIKGGKSSLKRRNIAKEMYYISTFGIQHNKYGLLICLKSPSPLELKPKSSISTIILRDSLYIFQDLLPTRLARWMTVHVPFGTKITVTARAPKPQVISCSTMFATPTVPRNKENRIEQK